MDIAFVPLAQLRATLALGTFIFPESVYQWPRPPAVASIASSRLITASPLKVGTLRHMGACQRVKTVLVWLLVAGWAMAALGACDRYQRAREPHPTAPADWAARRGLETGDPAGGAPVDPRDARATASRDTAERRAFWTNLTIGTVVATGVVVAFGVWLLESRRGLRRRAEALEQRVVARIQADARLAGVPVIATPRMPLWRGPVQLDLVGSVPSELERDLVRRLVQREVEAVRFPVRVNEVVRIEATTRPVDGVETRPA